MTENRESVTRILRILTSDGLTIIRSAEQLRALLDADPAISHRDADDITGQYTRGEHMDLLPGLVDQMYVQTAA